MSFEKLTEVFQTQAFKDSRGQLTIKLEDEVHELSIKESFSRANTFRGMHIQVPPYDQTKFIKVLSGKIIDCIYVLDSEHPDFGKFFSYEIDSKENYIKIPSFCAHGFYAKEDTRLMYICAGNYSEDNEKAIKPIKMFTGANFSNKDMNASDLNEELDFFKNIKWRKYD